MERNRDIKVIDLIQIATFLLLFPHLKPAYLNHVPMFDNIFNLLRLASGLVIFIIVIKKNKINLILTLFIVFQCILIFSTLVNNGDMKNLFFDTYSILTLSLFIDYKLKSDAAGLIKVLLFCFELLIYINLFTVIAFPNGLYSDWTDNNWFLGTDNQHVAFMITGICISVINAKLHQQYIRALCLTVASYVSIFWIWSATAVSGMMVFLILFIATVIIDVKSINFAKLWTVNIIIFFSIIIFKIQNLFSFIIVDILGKSLTFTGRIYIWESAIEWIKKSWLLGYGFEYSDLHIYKTIYPSCHNILLENMYEGGIVLIICFICIHVCYGKKLMEYKHTLYAKMISISVFILYFMMLFETYNVTRIYPLFLIAFHLEELLKYEKKAEVKTLSRVEEAA